MNLRLLYIVGLSLFFVPFQNCSKVGFDAADSSVAGQGTTPNLGADTTDNFSTKEDVAVSGQPQTASAQTGQASTFATLSSPNSGTLSAFDPVTGKFTYKPKSHFFGQDHFQLTETNPGLDKSLIRSVTVDVVRIGQPYVISDVFNFNLNTNAVPFTVVVGDAEVANPFADLSIDGSVATLATAHGTVTKTGANFSYTPNADFRGTDVATFFARDSQGGLGSRKVNLVVGNPLQSIQPGMAVRAANCIQCHAQISSNFVTDFGNGSSYYFAHDKSSVTSGDWIYSLRMANDGKTYFPDWITTAAFANGAQLIVPKANLGFKYADVAPSFMDKTTAWLQSTTLADLMTQIQKIAGATFKATVVEKNTVYIGAPSVAEIQSAGQLDAGHPVQYWKDSDQSFNLAGFTRTSAGYYTNSGTLVCDGDLFVDGTVYLDTVKVKTLAGCRLHATGPVFVQKSVTYVDAGLDANPNLQLVSARSISFGVGLTHCESSSNPGWYYSSRIANPLLERFVGIVGEKGVATRNTTPSSGFPQTASSQTAEGNYIVGEAQKIVGLEDASCHGRSLAFERLMLVAPQVHSRYKGNFSGVVIGEFPMFSLQAFVYKFDPVFLKVPVLPLMDMSKILVIQ